MAFVIPASPAVGDEATAAWAQQVAGSFSTLGSAWSSYTPTWTGATTNPAIGNGTLSGRYVQIGKTLWLRIGVVMGSTTTYGSGAWSWSLPSGLTLTSAISRQVGSAWGRDDSSGLERVGSAMCMSIHDDVVYRVYLSESSGASVSNAVPWSWASADEIHLSMMLELA